MNKSSDTQRVYVIRCWRTESKTSPWRFGVQDIHHGQTNTISGFSNLAELLDFLVTEFTDEDSDPGSPTTQSQVI